MDLSAKHEAKYQYWRKYLFKNNKALYNHWLDTGFANIRHKSYMDKIVEVWNIIDRRPDWSNIAIGFNKAKEIVNYKNKQYLKTKCYLNF